MNRPTDQKLRQELIRHLEQAGPAGLSLRQLLRRLGLDGQQRRRLRRILGNLASAGKIVKAGRGRWRAGNLEFEVEGIAMPRGRGWLQVNGARGIPVRIPPDGKNGAMPGDRVRARVLSIDRGGTGTGRVESVIERSRDIIVGTLHRRGRFVLLVPDEKGLDPIIIRRSSTRGAEDGMVVAARPDPRNPLQAELVRVIGEPGQLETEIERLEIALGLDGDFPPPALEQAEEAASSPPDPARRVDLRHVPHLTIDPDDAKDFDDAVYAERANGGYRLLVSIADVSAHVPAGGPLDEEALSRGCSIYLPHRVHPMLPEVLSADACSLKQGTERAAVTIEMELDESGAVTRSRACRSVIKCHSRLAYRRAQEILDGKDNGGKGGTEQKVLRACAECARLLLKRLRGRGMLELDIPELEIELDATGHPASIRPAARYFTHRLIEAFMITANEQVAAFMERNGLPAIYRVHPPPDPEKLEAFRLVAEQLGHRLSFNDPPTTLELAGFVRDSAGRPGFELLHTLLLRSLMQASYSASCEQHFGLASDAYLHFTSPIRRYPDLVVHRVLAAVIDRRPGKWLELESKADKPANLPDGKQLERIAQACSDAERRAVEAERQARAIFGAAYLQKHIGETFEGRISFVTEFGMFVMHPSGVEGLVHVGSMRDDFYRFVPERLTLVGRRSGKSFSPGMAVSVRIADATLYPPSVELVLSS